MPIIASAAGESGTKYLHPADQYGAVCIDIIDLGKVKTEFNNKVKFQHKIVIRFWCGEYNEEGEPLFVGERFTLSLHEKAALRPFLEAWRGKRFTAEELNGFDIENLIGAHALIQVSHATRGEKTYANIDSIMKLPKGSEQIMPLADYVRVCDRPREDSTHEPEGQHGPSTPSAFDPDDSDLPF